MRTVKRHVASLNEAKKSALQDLCYAYACEKRHWLDRLRSYELQAKLDSYRRLRDQFVKEGYQSIYGLQARHWKLSLKDAVETWDKYWQALFAKIRPKIARRHFKEQESHYAYFLISGYRQFAALMKGDIPEAPFEVEKKGQKLVAGYVRRLVKRFKGKAPVVKKARLAKFDANCYDTFEHKGRQYVKLMSLEKGRRIILPLEGKAAIRGNIAVVFEKARICVHICQETAKKTISSQNVVAVDFGYTEVMTDTEGRRYGKGFGKILNEKSDQLSKKNKERNKLHALEKKHPSLKKAQHIRKYNLGRKKADCKRERWQASLKAKINEAIHEVIKAKRPAIFITEDLSHLFTYKKSPAINRRLSSWIRGEIQNRVSFKALAEGFRHEQVNPAYGSQICPKCDFVDSKNRIADKFKCLYCRHEDISDRVAALNYARRFGDQEIERYTPYREVKTIYLSRFYRRLEAEQSVTVPGRTRETVAGEHPLDPDEIINIIAGRESSRENRAVKPRAKQNKHVLTRF